MEEYFDFLCMVLQPSSDKFAMANVIGYCVCKWFDRHGRGR